MISHDISTLLDRLGCVKQTGSSRWIARCPAHDDHSPSLSIRELADGRILIHDFAGCSATDVLTALGMQMTDLFPDRLGHHFRPTRSRIPAGDILATLDHESLVVAIVGADFLEHKEIDDPTWARLAQAVSRVNEARSMCAPAKVSR